MEGLWSYALLSAGSTKATSEPADNVQSVTCSVVPGLTRIWSTLFLRATEDWQTEVIMADCSGGTAAWASSEPRIQRIPLFNASHGAKLDLLVSRVCSARLVVISDDDIFWMDGKALGWAIEQLESRPRLAAVSFYPRESTKPILAGKVDQPMGSFCLVIRREVFVREGISFACVATGDGSYEHTYDTADRAHLELLNRGYEIEIAPEASNGSLCTIEGVSTWSLKLQKHGVKVVKQLQTSLRAEKAFRVYCFLDRLAEHLPESPAEELRTSSPWRGLPPVLSHCSSLIEADARKRIELETQVLSRKIAARYLECIT